MVFGELFKSGIVYVDEMRDEAEQRLEERDIE